jgi:hypothetical protein
MDGVVRFQFGGIISTSRTIVSTIKVRRGANPRNFRDGGWNRTSAGFNVTTYAIGFRG